MRTDRILERTLWRDLAAIVVLAIGLRLVAGSSTLNFDAAWGLAWGVDLATNGNLPDGTITSSPTSRPLATGVSGLLAIGGEPFAHTALLASAFLAWAAVIVLVYRLGALTFSRAAGAVAAVLLTLSPFLAQRALVTFQDVPFCALILLAAILESQRPRRGASVAALLAVAGLIRPQAWVIAGAYWLWLMTGRPARRELVVVTALTAAGPLLWMLYDLLATGDPLDSFTRTREGADIARRVTGIEEVPGQAWLHLRSFLTTAAALAGVAAFFFLAARPAQRRRALPVLALAVLGALDFILLGFGGLPLNDRYMLVPITAVALLAGWALTDWLSVADRRLRAAWATGAVVLLGAIAIPHEDRLPLWRDSARFSEARAATASDLRALARDAAVRRAVDRCGRRVYLDRRAQPVFMAALSRPPGDAVVRDPQLPAPSPALVVVPANERAARLLLADGGPLTGLMLRPPSGSRPGPSHGDWRVALRGC